VAWTIDGFVRPNAFGISGFVGSGHEQPVPIFQQSPEVIHLAVMMYVREPRSGGTGLVQCLPPRSARDAPRTRAASSAALAFVKVKGKFRYLWRAVDHKGEVLEAVVTSKGNKAAAP
jgi:putative transposase